MGLLHKILFLIVVLCVFRQATSQSPSSTSSGSGSASISNTVSVSMTTSMSGSVSGSMSGSVSVSVSVSMSTSGSISNTVSNTISNSISISTSVSISQTVTYQYGLPQITGVSNACPTIPTEICVYFNTPSPSYPQYNIYFTRNGTSLQFTTTTVPTSASPFIISQANAPGFTPGSTYYVQVTGVTAAGAEGPLSVPLVVTSDFPPIDSQPFDTSRIHDVRCGLVGNLVQCRWINGLTYTFSNTTLVARCMGMAPNTFNFQHAGTTFTTTSTDTFLEVPVPFASVCTTKLKSKYLAGGVRTKFPLRNIMVPQMV